MNIYVIHLRLLECWLVVSVLYDFFPVLPELNIRGGGGETKLITMLEMYYLSHLRSTIYHQTLLRSNMGTLTTPTQCGLPIFQETKVYQNVWNQKFPKTWEIFWKVIYSVHIPNYSSVARGWKAGANRKKSINQSINQSIIHYSSLY